MEKTELYKKWLKAKKAENKAKNERVEIEAEIEALIPSFEGQSKTFTEDGFKITVKKNETYSFDKNLDELRKNSPEHLRPVRIKCEVDCAGLDYMRNSPNIDEQEAFRSMSNYITCKPGKTSFKIEKE